MEKSCGIVHLDDAILFMSVRFSFWTVKEGAVHIGEWGVLGRIMVKGGDDLPLDGAILS